MLGIDCEAVAVVVWENEFPDDFDFDDDLEEILNEFCSEMNEKYSLSGRYTSREGHHQKIILTNDMLCLSVQRNNVILDIPTDFLDIHILINIIDRKYGDIVEQ